MSKPISKEALEVVGAILEEAGVSVTELEAIANVIRQNKPEHQAFFKDACEEIARLAAEREAERDD